MLQAALSRRANRISTSATVDDVDRNAIFIIPDSVVAAESPGARRQSHENGRRLSNADEHPAVQEIAAASALTPRSKMGLSPRYLPVVVAAGLTIVADSKDVLAPPPTRDRKKRELRPKDTVATLLSDASAVISDFVEDKEEEQLRSLPPELRQCVLASPEGDSPEPGFEPDSPLSRLVRTSSKRTAQTVRVNLGAVSNACRTGSKPQVKESPTTDSDVSAATVEEVVTGQIAPETLSPNNASEGRVLSETEIKENNRRTLDWFRNSENVNRASQISLDFASRLSVLRRKRNLSAIASLNSEASAASGTAETSPCSPTLGDGTTRSAASGDEFKRQITC